MASNQPLADLAIRSQAEVAAAMGISRARVMQLEQSGLRKMRRALDAEERREQRRKGAR